VVKPQGRRGEVAAELHTDFPERFAERTRIFFLDRAGGRRELQIQQYWPHKGRVVLKFAGVDCIDDAAALVGGEIQIPSEQRAALEPGAAYVSDLIGCTVMVGEDAGQAIGAVADVQFGAGEAPLLIVRQGAKEFMVPLAEEFLRRLDLAGKRIHMVLPEGMLDLDAGLTAEEKAAQRKGSS
jgi:16S rRNA processing protein RimM